MGPTACGIGAWPRRGYGIGPGPWAQWTGLRAQDQGTGTSQWTRAQGPGPVDQGRWRPVDRAHAWVDQWTRPVDRDQWTGPWGHGPGPGTSGPGP